MVEGYLFFCSPNARKEAGVGGHAAYRQTTSQILKGAKEKQFFWAGQKMNYIRVENSCVCAWNSLSSVSRNVIPLNHSWQMFRPHSLFKWTSAVISSPLSRHHWSVILPQKIKLTKTPKQNKRHVMSLALLLLHEGKRKSPLDILLKSTLHLQNVLIFTFIY